MSGVMGLEFAEQGDSNWVLVCDFSLYRAGNQISFFIT